VDDLVVPVERFQVHQHGAAGVGHVGDVLAAVGAAGEVPDDPGVDVAEDGVAALGCFAHAVNVLQDPFHLRAGEVGRQRQTNLGAEAILAAVARERVDDTVGPRVLPDNRVVIGLAGVLVPDDGCLALVGNAHGGDVVGGRAGLTHRFPDHVLGARPDFQRVVLHPAGLRVDLLVLHLV